MTIEQIVENYTKEIIDNVYAEIKKQTGISFERILELAKADKENRLVVFQPEFSVVKIYYPKDEDGLYAMKAIGIVSEEEYLKHLEDENESHTN